MKYPSIKGPDTRDICYATQNRQKAVRDLAKFCDVVLVLGNKNSSNSVRLAEISSLTGIPTYRISDHNELNIESIKNYNIIGVTASASTPEIFCGVDFSNHTNLNPSHYDKVGCIQISHTALQ